MINIINEKTDINIKRNPYYIYNFNQINWMLEQGCIPISIGKGLKGDIYLRFPRTNEIENVVCKWKLREY